MATARADRSRRSRSSWLRLVLFNVIFIGLPLGVYFVFYVDARVEQTTVRNFRALDAAANRLVQVIDNVPRIAENAPAPSIPDPSELTLTLAQEGRGSLHGEARRMRAELDSRRAQLVAAAGAFGARGAALVDKEIADLERKAYVIERQLLSGCSDPETTATQGRLQAINSLSSAYVRDFEAAAGAPKFRLEPIALPAVNGAPTAGSSCRDMFLRALDTAIRRNGDAAGPCSRDGITRRLIRTADGVELEVEDCRQFSRRAPGLARALDDDAFREVLDRYGVRIAMGMDSLVRDVVANVAPLFDQYLITDAEGQVLYLAESDAEGFRYDAATGAPRGRRVRLDFVSQVDLRELVSSRGSTTQPLLSSTLGALSSRGSPDGAAAQENPEWSRYGIHSRLEQLVVGDIRFTAFLHPFLIDGLQPLVHPDDPEGERSPVLYMIGIVNRDSLSRESLRLRLSLVGDALLGIGVLFASLALIWLWTAGDRLTLGPRHLLVVFVTGLTSALLSSLLVLHVGARNADAAALDATLERVGVRIRDDFGREVGDRLDDLAQATVAMARAGETPARQPDRADGNILAVADSGEANRDRVSARVQSRFSCRPGSGPGREYPAGAPGADSASRFPSHDLAFLLDEQGRQWQCLSYRLFDTPPLDLKFRGYFQRPRDGELWRSGGLPEFFIQRVTSVLDGSTETVLSARPAALCGGDDECEGVAAEAGLASAVIIGRLHSLEEAVLPPHLRLAVLENETGATLFHSVRNRALASNFVKQTEGAPALLSHIDAGSEGFVDLEYHGTSIRAFTTPLTPGVPWTLIIYRGHELEDTIGAITVSATATSMVLLWLMLAVFLLLGWLLLRRRVPGWRVPALAELTRALTISVLALALAMAAVVWWLPWAGGLAAIVALLAAPLVVGAIVVLRRRGPRSWDEAVSRTGRREVLAGLSCLIVLLAVLPSIGLFAYFRAEVSNGLGHYLQESTIDEIVAKCERHRRYARRYRGGYGDGAERRPADAGQWRGIFDYGWTLTDVQRAPVDADPACAAFDGGDARRAAVTAALPMVPAPPARSRSVLEFSSSFSNLADDLVVRAAMVGPSPALASPGAVLDRLLGDSEQGFLGRLDREQALVLLLLGVVAGTLVRLTTVSLADRLLGCHAGIARLPEARVATPPSAWRADKGPLRACVVHRSENLCALLIDRLVRERFATAQRARWTGEEIVWDTVERGRTPDGGAARGAATVPAADTAPDSADGTLHVVEGFEKLLMDTPAREALLMELEQLMSTGKSLLVCSRILPGYWLSKLTEEAVSELADVPEEVAQSTRWSYVVGPLDVRRIRDRRESLIERFDRELERLDAGEEVPAAVRRSMLKEGVENPDLLNLAGSVARYAARTGCSNSEAMQRFAAGAAGHFHELWATSSFEERLQLFALARNGFANPTQTTVLSSLTNRGLITSSGVIQLRSPAFGRFIINDLTHDTLLAWRDEGHGNRWRSIWPPLVIIVVLALTFFVSSTPEALAPLAVLLAAGLGTVPVVGSVIRSVNDLRQSSAGNR